MSFLSWFSLSPRNGTAARKTPRNAPQPKAGAAPGRAPQANGATAADQLGRKNIRMERRESLYMVVRDAMVRVGVLSAGYKFKVLSLDQFGQQFVVMIDLASEYGSSTARLSEIETLIMQSAKSRFEILVTAVYWRMHDNTAVGVRMRRAADKDATPMAGRVSAPQTLRAPIMPTGPFEARASAPAPLRPTTGSAPLQSAQAPLMSHSAQSPLMSNSLRAPLAAPASASAPAPLVPSRSAPAAVNGSFDPIEDDEVAAFKRALHAASGGGQRAVSAAERPGTVVRSGPITRSPLLQPSGFADTVMPAQDNDAPSSDLSATQYGDLR